MDLGPAATMDPSSSPSWSSQLTSAMDPSQIHRRPGPTLASAELQEHHCRVAATMRKQRDSTFNFYSLFSQTEQPSNTSDMPFSGLTMPALDRVQRNKVQ